MQEKSCAN